MPILIAVIQIMLYVYFYVTLKSEDYALLMGSLGLFCVLAIVMYVTRKINWYESN
jgi:inner membrane protein